MTGKTRVDQSNPPYRLGVGLFVLNAKGQVFMGRPVTTKLPIWQLPQGGYADDDVDLRSAVMREMLEELGTDKGQIIAEGQDWTSYNFPDLTLGPVWPVKYAGQKQKWFALRFTGQDSDILIHTETPEFFEWAWVEPQEIIQRAISFKKHVYTAVLQEFSELL